MFRFQSSKWIKSFLLIISIALISWLVWTDVYKNKETSGPAEEANPLATAWKLAQAVGQYDFTVEGQQILRPRPIPSMIGQSGQAVDISIDGEALSSVSSQLTVKLDGAGLDPTPVTLLQEGTQTYLIKGDEKKLTQNPLGSMAPTGSYISYLAAADNVQPCEDDSALTGAAACYTYDINGKRFAEYIRDQMQTMLNNDPSALPVGAAVQIAPSPQLMKMSGSGMVILDERNLPMRMVLDIVTPEIDQFFDGKNHSVVDFEFDPAAVQVAMATHAGTESFWSRFNPVDLDFSGPLTFIAALAPASLLLIWHRRRWFYGLIAIFVSVSMVSTPLVQAAGITRYVQRQDDAAQTLAETFTADASETLVPVAPPARDAVQAAAPVFEPSSYCGKDSDVNRDSDGDGLADDAEYCLGTNPLKADSDYDGLSDGVETTGFDFNGQTWYSDPLKPDSNGDGLNDSVEWKAPDGAAAEWDTDGDNIPNLWDYDDDGDGVDDGLDASPYSSTDYLAQEQFSFDIIGRYDSYIYIDMQIQPENMDHLRYGSTGLNWQFDSRGQIKDLNSSKDDITLIPMLEVETNLPPSREMAEEYNVSVFTDTLGIGRQNMNIPLYPVMDGGKVQALSFRMAYGPDQLQALGDDGIHWENARLVWSVRAKLDKEVNNNITERTSAIHIYTEPYFRMTGWSVTKSGPYRSAIIGTPDTPANDRDLFQVLFGLSSSFLTNPAITLDEVNSRLSGINTPIEQRWGVSANVKVDLPIQSDPNQSAGLITMNDRINSFLGVHYPGNTPHTVIIAAESEMGLYDQDELGQLTPDGSTLSVNLKNISMARQRTLTLHMRDGTRSVQGDDFMSALLKRYADDVDNALDDLTDQYPLLTAGELVSLLQTMYMTWENGRTRLLSFDGAVSNPTTLTDTEIYEVVHTNPLNRYGEPENISTLPGYLVEVGRFAREGSGMIFSGGPGQVWQYLQANSTEAMMMGFTAGAVEFIKQATDVIENAIGEATRLNEIPYADLKDYTATKYSVLENVNNSATIAITAIGTVDTAFGIADATLDLSGDAAKAAGKAAKWGAKVTKYAKVGGKISKILGPVSLGVELALIWTSFIMGAIMSGEFSMQAFAMALAATVLAIVLFLISTIPVWVAGAIIALVGLVDLVLMLIPGCDVSITGTVTKYLAGWFYEERILTTIGDVKFLGGGQGLISDEMGYVVGNRYLITDTFVGSIKQTASKGVSVTGGKSGAVGEGGVKLDKKALSYSWICAEYILAEGSSVQDNAVERNRCTPGGWYFERTYNYADKTVTYTNPMGIVIPFTMTGEYNLTYNTQIVAQTANYVSSMYGMTSAGYKTMKFTLPKDMPKKKQWQPMDLYLDILPATVEGMWKGENTYITNPDPDGDGMTTREEITHRLSTNAFSIMADDLAPIAVNKLGFFNLEQLLVHWDTYETRSDISAICSSYSADWPNFNLCDTSSPPFWLTWDSDGDSLSDKFEFDENGSLGTNIDKADTDGDGLNDGLEYRMGTRIDLADTDLDGLSDSEEALHLKDDGTLGGGWSIEVLKPGAAGPSGRYTTTITVYSDPRSADADGDGLSDLEEKKYGTSPNAYNRMPRVELTGSPFDISPAGAEAMYVKPGTDISFKASLQSFVPYTVAGTLTVDMPWHLLTEARFTGFSGNSSPANTGAGGNPEWSFAADPLFPGEEAHTTITAQTGGSQSMTGTATIRLPLEPVGWQPLSGGLNSSSSYATVYSLAVDPTAPNALYAGGMFDAAGGRPAANIARWNGSSWAALSAGLDSTVYAVAVDDSGQVYVGGSFTHAGGKLANRIAKWTGTDWEAVGSGFDDWVYDLAFDSSGNLYAVGDFDKAGETTVNGVAKWNGSSWSALGSGVDTMKESWVSTIAIDSNDNVYIGGHFYSVSGVNTSHAAKWNGSSWSTMDGIHGGGGLYGSIKDIAIDPGNNQVYAGGDIWQANGVDAKAGVIKWNGSSWEVLPHVADNPDTGENQECLALTFDADGNLFAGGKWTETGGEEKRLARWDGNNWSFIGQPDNTSSVGIFDFAVQGENLFMSGYFGSVDKIPANNIAFYTTTDSQVQEDSVTVVVDAENPTIGLTSPRHGEMIGGGVTDYVIGGFSGDVTTWVKQVDVTLPVAGAQTIDRTPDMTLSPWAYTWNLPADGVYDVSATATDFVGNVSGASTAQVMVDNTAADTAINLSDGAVYGPPQSSDIITITLTGTATDNLSGLIRVQISTDDGPWREVWTSENPTGNTTYTDHSATFRHHATAVTWSAEWTLPNVESVQGYHSVKVRAFDLAGNLPQILERNIIIDVIPPTDDLTNQAYLYSYPHIPTNQSHTLRGVANDVGNVPEPARPDELLGTLDSIDNATIWLGLDSIADDDAGVTVNWIGDFNGDRRGDLLIGTPSSAGGAGRISVVYGRSGDWTVPDAQEMISDNYTSFVGLPGAGIGDYAIPAGDVNGDGIADLLVGDPVNSSVYVIFGKSVYYGRDIVLDGYLGGRRVLLTVPEGQQIGQNIGAAGDVNGDGIDDLLIGATNGPAYLLLGMEDYWREIVPLDVFAAATISGAGNATLTGVGDMDGDFLDEFAVGQTGVYVFDGKNTYANQGLQSLGLGSADYSFGSTDGRPGIARLGDVNGDQKDDFIYTSGGSQPLISNGGVIHTYSYGSGFVAAPGDVDNDGKNDILIGGNGDAHLVLGSNLSGTQATISGVSAAASTLYAAGADLNSDGSSDLLLLPTAVGGVAANNASSAELPSLPPAWMPRVTAQNLSTYVDNSDWSVSGADAYVNGDGTCHGLTPCYTTIQAAVTARSGGDLISVQPGVYAPFVVDGKDNMTIRGTDPDAVFVDANNGTYAAHITNADGVRLEQMTLRNASYGVQLTNAGVGGHKTAELSKRAILDHLLVYDVGSHDVYMDRSSTLTVTRSTLVNSGSHVGVNMSSPADTTIPTGWYAEPSIDSLYDGGGLTVYSDTMFYCTGNGARNCDIYKDGGWQVPFAPRNPIEANSAIAAGSDGQFYVLGGPSWKDASYSGTDIFDKFAEGPDGIVYTEYASGAGGPRMWNGTGWSEIPGLSSYLKCYRFAAHPVNGNLYCVSYSGGVVNIWDGSSWTETTPTNSLGSNSVHEIAVDSDGHIHAVGNMSLRYGTMTNSCYGYAEFTGSDWYCGASVDTFEDSDALTNVAIDSRDTVYVGGKFVLDWGPRNLASMNGSIGGVGGEVYDIEVGENDVVYVSGAITATFDYSGNVDQLTPAGIAAWDNGSWTVYPAVPDPIFPDDTGSAYNWQVVGYYANGLAETNGGELYTVGIWNWCYDESSNSGACGGYGAFTRWNGTAWEKLGQSRNDSTNGILRNIGATGQGVFISGDFHYMDYYPGGGTFDAQDKLAIQFPHEVMTTTNLTWNSSLIGAPMTLGDGASMAGDANGNLILLVGGGRKDSFKYNIQNKTWTRIGDMPDAVNGSAMVLGENDYIYAITDGSSKFYQNTGSSWSAVTGSSSGITDNIADGASLTYDSKRKAYYMVPGGNSTHMYRYDTSTDSWSQLPADRDTPAGIGPGSGIVFMPGTPENSLYMAPGSYGGTPNTGFYRYPLPEPNKIGFENSAIVVPAANSAANWLNQSDPLPDDFNFRIGTGSQWFNSTGKPNNGWTLPTSSANPFLDQNRDLYRMGKTGYNLGYHTYTAPVTATTATGIQAQINSGANRVIVQPGIYEEPIYLVNGVDVIGANPDWTIIRPPTGSSEPLARAAGPVGASLSRVTLDGQNTGLNGFEVTGNAKHITFTRSLIYDTDTAILVDGAGSDLEVANVTAALNTNGFAATNDAPVDVRNSIFAYNSGIGLSHTAGASPQLHTYNLFWENLGGHFGGAADAGAAELLIDPNFVDPLDHDYRTLNFSPVIDAGNPTDPAPPSDGNRADMGYVEQGRANFYVDDGYCLICVNDGLTWQVDAFDNIQAALNAAKSTLQYLNATEADVPQLVVGVAAGTYTEDVIVPGHTLLLGSGAEVTTLNGSVTFDGITDSGVRDFTITGASGAAVHVTNASNTIAIHYNIIHSNSTGVLLDGRGTADLTFNTFVNNAIGVKADEAGSWANVVNNIISGGSTGLNAINSGQIFGDYNLLNAATNYSGVTSGEFDQIGNPQFDSGNSSAPYRLTAASPALDAASVGVDVPDGGGTYADLGYSELLAAPISLLLGKENLSTVMGNSGVKSVEYAVVPIADATQPVTATLPGAWTSVTLDTPGETYSYWQTPYTPQTEGMHRFYSRATDMVDNQETEEADWYDGSFVADSADPVVEWLSPVNGATLNAPLELRARVTDYAAGEFSVEEKDVHFVVDGTTYPATWAAEPWDESAGEARVFRAWITPTVALHSNVVAFAEDKAGNSSTDNSFSFTVSGLNSTDTTAPALSVFNPVNNGWVTNTVTFAGVASDGGSGVAAVEVSMDGGLTWNPATVNGNNWSLVWQGPYGMAALSYPAQVRATDRAGNSTMSPLVFTMDEMPPDGFGQVTFSAPEETHFDTAVTLTINWNAPTDGSGTATTLLVVDQITDTMPSTSVTGTTADRSLDANGEWYVHLGAVDAAGNTVVQHYGPWHVGIDEGVGFGSRRQSIVVDGFVDTANGEWQTDTEFLDNDERNIGVNVTYSPDGPQSFFTTWDQDQFYMAWQGGWWEIDGTLWVYLNTGSGGSGGLITPLTSQPTAALPFAANYAIEITAPNDGTLWQSSGGGWVKSSQPWTFEQGALGDTEIRLPLFGTTNIESLAFAQGDDGDVWAIFPATNPLTPAAAVQSAEIAAMAEMVAPLSGELAALMDIRVADATTWGSFHWDDLTVITDPAANQPKAVNFDLELDSIQSEFVPWAPGSTMEYVVKLTNQEDTTLTNQQLAFVAFPGTALIHDSIEGATCAATNPSWVCTVSSLPPGTTAITLTTHLAADLSGIDEVTMISVLQNASIPPELQTQEAIVHKIDSLPPEVIVSSRPFAKRGEVVINGIADDGDGIGVDFVEIMPDGGSWQRANGNDTWSADLTVSPFMNHGDAWRFYMRGTDQYGQVSQSQEHVFTVDLQGPVITLTTPSALSGLYSELTGTVIDGPTGSRAIQVDTIIDGGLRREAFLSEPDDTGRQSYLLGWNMNVEDSVTHTIQMRAVDTVGNIGYLSEAKEVVVDNVGPQLTVTHVLTQAVVQNYRPGRRVTGGPVISGTVIDGGSVTSVTVRVEPPGGGYFYDNATVISGTWQYVPEMTLVGTYTLQVEGIDWLGNIGRSSQYPLIVIAAPETTSDPYITYEDTPITIEPLADDVDLDLGDILSIESVGVPLSGTATISGSYSIVYTPTLNFNGTDVFTYTAIDTNLLTDTGTISVTVLPLNDAPVITPGNVITMTISEDNSPIPFDLTLYGEDVDFDPLTWTVSISAAYGAATLAPVAKIISQTITGTVTITDTSPPTDTVTITHTETITSIVYHHLIYTTTVAYTPTANYAGSANFAVQASDGALTDTVTISLTIEPVEDAPVANDDPVMMLHHGETYTFLPSDSLGRLDVLANDYDPEGAVLTITQVSVPDNGGATEINTAGTVITYTPASALTGAESFTYTITDGGASSTATVTATVVSGETGGASGQTFTATAGVSNTITVTVAIPAGSMTDTEELVLVYTEIVSTPTKVPAGQLFAGLMFKLDAYVNGVLTTKPYTFTPPITLTLIYSDTNVAHLPSGDGDLSMWYWWENSGLQTNDLTATAVISTGWYADGMTVVERYTETNKLVVTIEQLGDYYGLFGLSPNGVYLPLIFGSGQSLTSLSRANDVNAIYLPLLFHSEPEVDEAIKPDAEETATPEAEATGEPVVSEKAEAKSTPETTETAVEKIKKIFDLLILP